MPATITLRGSARKASSREGDDMPQLYGLCIMSFMTDRLSLLSEAGDVTITRDGYGVPHVRGETPAAAWFGMGYACARDRMFQMDYDRRRARGRWAEIAGRSAVGA